MVLLACSTTRPPFCGKGNTAKLFDQLRNGFCGLISWPTVLDFVLAGFQFFGPQVRALSSSDGLVVARTRLTIHR
jgi:hypothetical protein